MALPDGVAWDGAGAGWGGKMALPEGLRTVLPDGMARLGGHGCVVLPDGVGGELAGGGEVIKWRCRMVEPEGVAGWRCRRG